MLDPEGTASNAAGLGELGGDRDFPGIKHKGPAVVAGDDNGVLLGVREAELRPAFPVRVKLGDAARLRGAAERYVRLSIIGRCDFLGEIIPITACAGRTLIHARLAIIPVRSPGTLCGWLTGSRLCLL